MAKGCGDCNNCPVVRVINQEIEFSRSLMAPIQDVTEALAQREHEVVAQLVQELSYEFGVMHAFLRANGTNDDLLEFYEFAKPVINLIDRLKAGEELTLIELSNVLMLATIDNGGASPEIIEQYKQLDKVVSSLDAAIMRLDSIRESSTTAINGLYSIMAELTDSCTDGSRKTLFRRTVCGAPQDAQQKATDAFVELLRREN